MVAFVFLFWEVNATTTYSNWSGNVQGSQWIGLSWQKREKSGVQNVTVNWTDAEGSSFKITVRILNSNLTSLYSDDINYLGSTTFPASLVSGQEYLLQGKKTSMFAGKTFIKGNWRIN